jgi:hypothetical protein
MGGTFCERGKRTKGKIEMSTTEGEGNKRVVG